MSAGTEPDTGAATDVLDTKAAGGLVVRGGAWRLGGYGAALVLSVGANAVLTRHLGVLRFGEYTTVMSLVSIVSTVTDAGMSTIGTREYAVRSGAARDQLMRDLLSLRVALTLVGVVLATVFAVAAGYDHALILGTILASLGTVALVFQHTVSIPLSATLRLGSLSALDLARQVVLVTMIVALSVLGASLLPLLTATLVANALLILPTAALTRGQISTRLSLHPSAWPPLLRATVVYSLAVAVGTLYVFAAQLITSVVTTQHQSGLFAISFRVFIVAAGIPGLLVGGALPLLSRAARDDHERLEYALGKLFDVTFIGGVGGAIVLSAGSGFVISLIAGSKYRSAAPVLEIQALAMVASSVIAVWSFALLSLRMHRGLLFANGAALVVSLGLTIPLAASDGAQGAAIATLVGESTLALGTLIALVRTHPEHAPSLSSVTKVLFAAALAVLAAFVPSEPSLVRAVVAAVVYGAAVLLLRVVPQELLEIVPLKRSR